MKRLFSISALLFIALIFISSMILVPRAVYASACVGYETALVPCGQEPNCQCELTDLFQMVLRVYNFAVWTIALPLAGLIIVIGGVTMLVSAGNPGLAQKGKDAIKYSLYALVIIFGSWIIIDVVLKAIGYTLPWATF